MLAASAASAHCFLDHSTPSAGSKLDRPPSRIVLYFDNQFDPKATTVRVLTEKGDLVSGSASATSDNHALMAPLKALAIGQYYVKWRATSQDGDHTMGAYSFTVKDSH